MDDGGYQYFGNVEFKKVFVIYRHEGRLLRRALVQIELLLSPLDLRGCIAFALGESFVGISPVPPQSLLCIL